MLERAAWTVILIAIFIVLTIIGLFLLLLSYKLLQEGTIPSQVFGGGIGIIGIFILAKGYRSLGRISWSFAEFENERIRG